MKTYKDHTQEDHLCLINDIKKYNKIIDGLEYDVDCLDTKISSLMCIVKYLFICVFFLSCYLSIHAYFYGHPRIFICSLSFLSAFSIFSAFIFIYFHVIDSFVDDIISSRDD